MVENWWHLGLEIPRLGISQKRGRPKKSSKSETYITLQDLGVSFTQSQRCQKLAEFSKAELDEYLDAASATWLESCPTVAECERFVSAKRHAMYRFVQLAALTFGTRIAETRR